MLWRKLVLSLLLLASVTALHGQDIVGQWQGTVQTATPFRLVLKVLQNDTQPRTFIIFVDQSSDYFPLTTLSDSNGKIKFSDQPPPPTAATVPNGKLSSSFSEASI